MLGAAYADLSATAIVEHRVDGSSKRVSVHALQESVRLVAASLVQQCSLVPEDVIGLHLERGEAYTTLLFACSYLGCYALPMPTDYPDDRLVVVATTAAAKAVCVDVSLSKVGAGLRASVSCFEARALMRGGGGAPRPPPHVQDPQLGGIILASSGSTGTPKLIRRTQASFFHRLRWTWSALPYKPGEVCVQKSTSTTTHSLYELLEPVLGGLGCHVLPEVGQMGGTGAFCALLERLQVSRLLVVPTLLNAIFAADLKLPRALKIVVLMGESPPRPLCTTFVQQLPHVRLFSIYGSTESSSSVVLDISRELAGVARGDKPSKDDKPPGPLPLGECIQPQVRTFLLGEDGQPVPPGEVGTLHLEGPQLFAGYVGLAELTAEKLFDAKLKVGGVLQSVRLYNTLDRVVQRPSGALEHMGRADDMVKMRGFRIQLSEVDFHLMQCEGVTQSVTLLSADKLTLVSFVAPETVSIGATRKALRLSLPTYMVPGEMYALSSLPFTAGGKVDRKALAAMHTGYATLSAGMGGGGEGGRRRGRR
mgnify:CR=1 FL=1